MSPLPQLSGIECMNILNGNDGRKIRRLGFVKKKTVPTRNNIVDE